jgi:hypothetical protein
MKKNKWTNIILTVLILFAIGFAYYTWRRYQWYNPPYSPEINAVLFMAGDNRSELEKVLKHYGRNPADSLKLRATKFLIVNMPGKGTIAYDTPWENVAAGLKRMDFVKDKRRLLETFDLENKTVKEDIKYITGEYLINNIELAFKVWEEQPWGKDIPFDIFCEEILPYRYYNEPLENWREKVLISFFSGNEIIHNQKGITSVLACQIIHSKLPTLYTSYQMPPMNYSMMMASWHGSCDDMAAFEVFVMRALGIPVVSDFTMQWPHNKRGHSWNAVYDGHGGYVSFNNEIAPGGPHSGIYLSKGKVYRRTFARQDKSMIGNAIDIERLRDPYIVDASQYYERFTGIEIPLPDLPDDVQVVYLATMDNNQQWTPVDYSIVNQRKVCFSATGQNVLYQLVYYHGENRKIIGYPFWLDEKDGLVFLEPDTNNMFSVTVKAQSSARKNTHDRMINGFFEVANKPDFSDSVKLFTITSIDYYNEVKITNLGQYRYIRYVMPAQKDCNVAELQFFGKNKEELKGEILGTQHNELTRVKENAFDGDLMTYFETSEKKKGWIGLDLGEKHSIGLIRYMPYNDGYGINKGEEYELFYWNGTHWQSLGKQIAENHESLTFQAPNNAMLYLQNRTRNMSLRVFRNVNGEQKWL